MAMRRMFLILSLTIAGFFTVTTQSATAAQFSTAASATKSSATAAAVQGSGSVIKVRKWRRGRGWKARKFRSHRARRYRSWRRHNHYGNLIGGIILGTIIAAAARESYQTDDEDLCWYWTNHRHTHGYWDYCD